METVTLLGTAGAVTSGERDNVSLVFRSDSYHVLMECGGSAAHKLAKIGVAYETLQDIILTHTHLDHCYGLPGLIFSMRYKDQQRTVPLRIYCPEDAISDIQAVLDAFGLLDERFFPLELHGIACQENTQVLKNEYVEITATPVEHATYLSTLGLKIYSHKSGKTIVYSSDTGPSENLVRLAQGADLLLHECAGLSKHPIPELHSNALQVGEIAHKARVKQLVLIHLDMVLHDDPQEIVAEVQQNFDGPVVVASDFDAFHTPAGSGKY